MMIHAWTTAAAALAGTSQFVPTMPGFSTRYHITKAGVVWPVAAPAKWTRATLGAMNARTSIITMMGTAESFEVLGVKPGASHAELKAAYRERANGATQGSEPWVLHISG